MANRHSLPRPLLAAFILIIPWLLGSQALADLISCSSAEHDESYKIFVDEVKMTSAAPASAALSRGLSGLRDFVYSDLSALTVGQASVHRCDARFPRNEGEFDETEVSTLENLRVLLEVWGAADDPTRGRLGFVLVPAWKLTPPAVYVIRTGSSDFLAQARRVTEFRVFAPLALGIRAYQNQHYTEAIPPLCKGVHELDTLLVGPVSPAEKALRENENSLRTGVNKLISDAIARARVAPDSRYRLLQPPADGQFSCPGVGGVR